MASVEVATVPAESIPSEEKVEDIEEAVKHIVIEPTTEKAAEGEAPPSCPAEVDPVADQAVEESPDIVEKTAEESTETLTASEPGVESAQLEPDETPEPKEEGIEPPKGITPAKEESVAQATAVKGNPKVSSVKEEASAAVETAAEEKSEESLANGDSPAEIPDEKAVPIEESVVQEA